jgi:hypothetical protein
VRKIPDLPVWERVEIILLQKVENRLVQQVKNHADVVPVVKVLDEMNAASERTRRRHESDRELTDKKACNKPVVLGILFFQFLENSNFDVARLAVFLNCTNDRDRTECLRFLVKSFHNFAECTLSDQRNNLVCKSGGDASRNVLVNNQSTLPSHPI